MSLDQSKLPSSNRLKQLFDYSPETGLLIRKIDQVRRNKGEVFGTKNKGGYLVGSVDGKLYRVSRLVWVFANGDIQDDMVIDHINGDRADNRLSNLRMVRSVDNARNTAIRSDNTSGHVGVTWCEPRNKWVAQICTRGVTKNLGGFEILADAINARLAAQGFHGFHENHGRAG